MPKSELARAALQAFMIVAAAHVGVMIGLSPGLYFSFMSDPIAWKSQTALGVALFIATTIQLYTNPNYHA